MRTLLKIGIILFIWTIVFMRFLEAQNESDLRPVETISPICIEDATGDSPLNMLSLSPDACTIDDLPTDRRQWKLQKVDGIYKVFKDNTSVPTWFNNEIFGFDNPWPAWLSMACHDFELLYCGRTGNTGILFLGGEMNNNYAIWALKVDINTIRRPTEIMLADLLAGDELDKRFARYIKDNDRFYDEHIGEMVDFFFNSAGKTRKICQVYPENVPYFGDYSPLKILGNPQPTEKIPQPLRRAFVNGEPLQYLIEENNTSHIYKLGKPLMHNVWYKEVNHYKNPWVALLCLADPSIKVVARDAGNSTRFCMVSQRYRDNLWSWVASVDQQYPPREYLLINGNEEFQLTGVLQNDYVNGLPDLKSPSEQEFFLENAEQPNRFILLDFLSYSSGSPGRVLLWRRNDPAVTELFRVGDGLDDKAVKLHLVYDGEMQESFDWSEVAERYKAERYKAERYKQEPGWCREEFKKQIARDTSPNLEAWFGENRLGLAKANLVGVFLPRPYRDFEFTDIKKIISLVDDLSYIPYDSPSKEILFKTWVRNDWREMGVWRANPLGYFDRVNY